MKSLKINIDLFIMAITIFCIILYFFRVVIAQNFNYHFLIWNLTLALIPYKASQYIKSKDTVFFTLSFIVWLAFFPNAPYLVTDVIHAGLLMDTVPIFYNYFMLVSYALLGLLLCFRSMELTFNTLKHKFIFVTAIKFYFFTYLFSAIAIFIGRFMRWNSWDLLFNLSFIYKDFINIFADSYLLLFLLLSISSSMLFFYFCQLLYTKITSRYLN
ncbi:MAG: DUF1361 domain-containing protein [Patescibacteria group bacterium]